MTHTQDKLIISTALPQITDTFNSQTSIGWYGTSYLLTNCAFQLVFGKIYKFFPIKATFSISILVFEAGSAICAAAPNSISFIIGRAVAGLGAGGVLSGVVSFSFFICDGIKIFLAESGWLTVWRYRWSLWFILSRYIRGRNIRVSLGQCLVCLLCLVLLLVGCSLRMLVGGGVFILTVSSLAVDRKRYGRF
jgi:MFS family permease